MTHHRPVRLLAYGLLALTLGLASQARAVDGVIEINQASADKGGVTPGDAPGLPITISTGTFAAEPMSFRLTGPLINSTSANVIEITSPNVTVDLNGFAITCLLVSCTGNGIFSGSDNITVLNGTVHGYAVGVRLIGSGAHVENVRATGSGIGLSIGNDCLVRNNVVTTSSAQGIKVDNRCIVSGNTANSNSVGIVTGNDSLILNNVASGNTAEGIKVSNGCTVSGNTANTNGNDGICTLQGTNVIGNTVDNNTGFGLNLANAVGYSGNVIWNNTAGTVLNGTAAGNNVCNGTTTCP